MMPAALARPIEILLVEHSTGDPDVTTILADERRLLQILVNLLTNAITFTPEGGAVGLEVRGDPAQQRVTFSRAWRTRGTPPVEWAGLPRHPAGRGSGPAGRADGDLPGGPRLPAAPGPEWRRCAHPGAGGLPRAGADAYLAKPVSLCILLDTIQTHLDRCSEVGVAPPIPEAG